jgi:hypothetical protein
MNETGGVGKGSDRTGEMVWFFVLAAALALLSWAFGGDFPSMPPASSDVPARGVFR